MKVRVLVFAVIVCFAGPLWAQQGAPLKDSRDRMSYTVGVDIANTLKKQSIDVNLDVVGRGMADVLSGGKLLLSDEEMAEAKRTIEKEVSDRKNAVVAALSEKNKKEEEKFLVENKAKKGVVCLPSGLQYMVLKEGTGKKPKEDDAIAVHYRVMRLDESEIESSYKKPEPETFSLENVVPGWREGAMLMPAGSKWRLYVPSKLAYGEDGVGEIIGPNTMLIFELELVRIIEKPAQEDLTVKGATEGKGEAKSN
jgi:FKBP-type peptidyl-prolyl cis-trans isomerase FklB